MIPTKTKSEIARDNSIWREYLGTSIDRFINYELRSHYSDVSLKKSPSLLDKSILEVTYLLGQ